jgi:folate-binding protein YgfZ
MNKLSDIALLSDFQQPGRLWVRGKDGLDLLHRLSTNDLRRASDGYVVPTVFTTPKGRIIDFVFVSCVEGGCLLLTSPGAETDVRNWIEGYTISEEVAPEAVTDRTQAVSIHGYHAADILSSALNGTDVGRDKISIIRDRNLTIVPVHWNLFMSFVIIGPKDSLGSFIPRMLEMGTRQASADETEWLRIIRRMPGRPNELSQDHTPYDAGLDAALSGTKGCYIGQEVIARLATYGKAKKTLAVLESSHGAIEQGKAVIGPDGNAVGYVTSSSSANINGRFVALAVVDRSAAESDGATYRVGTIEAAIQRAHQEGIS